MIDLGLGLAISRRFCRMTDGNTMVESTLRDGWTFTMRLPVAVKSTSEPEETGGRRRR